MSTDEFNRRSEASLTTECEDMLLLKIEGEDGGLDRNFPLWLKRCCAVSLTMYSFEISTLVFSIS